MVLTASALVPIYNISTKDVLEREEQSLDPGASSSKEQWFGWVATERSTVTAEFEGTRFCSLVLVYFEVLS